MTRKALGVGLLLVAVAAVAGVCAQTDEGPQGGAPGSYERPAAGEILSTADEVLADPRYQPHKTLGQWFMEQVRGWDMPNLDLSVGWVRLLLWIVTIWGVITIVAILVHVGWTLFTMLRPVRRGGAHVPRQPGLHAHLRLPYGRLMAMAREAADSGEYRKALHWTMLALLRYLADRSLIALHASKTNGDYVREFARATDAGQLMAQFARDFDRFTYGKVPLARSDFTRMQDTLKRIQADAVSQA